eukprot:2069123-Prymnesium_polylepis.1
MKSAAFLAGLVTTFAILGGASGRRARAKHAAGGFPGPGAFEPQPTQDGTLQPPFAELPASIMENHLERARSLRSHPTSVEAARDGGLWAVLNEATLVAQHYKADWTLGHTAQVPAAVKAYRDIIRTQGDRLRTICEVRKAAYRSVSTARSPTRLMILSMMRMSFRWQVGFNAGHSAAIWLEGTRAVVKSFDLLTLPYSCGSRAFLEGMYPGRIELHGGNSIKTVRRYAERVLDGKAPACDLWYIDGAHMGHIPTLDLRNAMAAAADGAIFIADDCTSRFFK